MLRGRRCVLRSMYLTPRSTSASSSVAIERGEAARASAPLLLVAGRRAPGECRPIVTGEDWYRVNWDGSRHWES